jgi:hypothetical protein
LKSTREDEITFYAHTKGVAHTSRKNTTEEQRIAIKQWRNRLYSECLGYPGRIDNILKVYSACGCFLRFHSKTTPWFFGGTFWWFNHQKLFTKNWKKIKKDRRGVEYYLSGFFNVKEVYELYCTTSSRLIFDVFRYYACSCGKDWVSKKVDKRCPRCNKKVTGKFTDIRYD